MTRTSSHDTRQHGRRRLQNSNADVVGLMNDLLVDVKGLEPLTFRV